MLINLWVRDNRDGTVHQVGTDVHDSINFMDGKVVYYNLQNGSGTLIPNSPDGYDFVEPPDLDDYVNVTPEQLYLNRELVHEEVMKKVMTKADGNAAKCNNS